MKTLKKHYDISGFIKCLSNLMNGKRVVVTDAGQSFFKVTADLKLKDGDRMICSYAQADMGFAVPASIGVALSSGRQVIVITGDGSFQLNIQELQGIKQHNLNIKIFVINNNGYETNRNTQKKFFGRLLGVDKDSGISFPSLKKIAESYGIRYCLFSPGKLKSILSGNNPVVCEVVE